MYVCITEGPDVGPYNVFLYICIREGEMICLHAFSCTLLIIISQCYLFPMEAVLHVQYLNTGNNFLLKNILHCTLSYIILYWGCGIKFLSLLFRISQTRLVYLCKGMVICLFSNPTTPSIFLFFSLYNHYIHDIRYTIQYTLYIIYIMFLYYIALFAVLW